MKNIILKDKEIEAMRHIRNFILHSGQMPSVRKLMKALGYRSPRSAMVMLKQLVSKGYLEKKIDGSLRFVKDLPETSTAAQTVNVPLVGCSACGSPILAEQNILGMIPVSVKLAKPPYKYFLLKVKGDSMDKKGINNNDLVLVKQQCTAKTGDIVVALIDGESTIKEFNKSGDVIVLKPYSSNKDNQPIILSKDFQIQGIAITVINNL